MKSEPDEFSIDDLARSPNSTGFWDVSNDPSQLSSLMLPNVILSLQNCDDNNILDSSDWYSSDVYTAVSKFRESEIFKPEII